MKWSLRKATAGTEHHSAGGCACHWTLLKGKIEKWAGTLCYMGIHPENNGKLLEEHRLSEKLLVSSFEGVLFFFLIPLGSEGVT